MYDLVPNVILICSNFTTKPSEAGGNCLSLLFYLQTLLLAEKTLLPKQTFGLGKKLGT